GGRTTNSREHRKTPLVYLSKGRFAQFNVNTTSLLPFTRCFVCFSRNSPRQVTYKNDRANVQSIINFTYRSAGKGKPHLSSTPAVSHYINLTLAYIPAIKSPSFTSEFRFILNFNRFNSFGCVYSETLYK
ncbi:MAG: hypothetical protein ACTS6G_03325, partial [Candidatus Hodgkinia cicadicola]